MSAWVPGDPVYPAETPSDEPVRVICAQCGTAWSTADITVCPECGHDSAAPVSAVAGHEPDEGLRVALAAIYNAAREVPEGDDLAAWHALGRCQGYASQALLAAPAAAPVGNEGPRCRYCGADCSNGRSWDGGDLYACGPCSDARAARNRPGDEGAARAAVARVLALCDLATDRGNPRDAWLYVADLRAALSAVSGEHRTCPRCLTAWDADSVTMCPGCDLNSATPCLAEVAGHYGAPARCARPMNHNGQHHHVFDADEWVSGEHREAEDGQ